MFFASLVAGNIYGQDQRTLIPSIGEKTNGTSISKSALVSAGKISIQPKTKKVNYFMMQYMNGNQTVELISNSENLTPEMKSVINGLPTGTLVSFAKISCKPINDKNAAPERVGELKLTIQ